MRERLVPNNALLNDVFLIEQWRSDSIFKFQNMNIQCYFTQKLRGFRLGNKKNCIQHSSKRKSISKYFILQIWATRLLFQTIFPWSAHGLFPFSRCLVISDFLLGTRGAKSFAGRIASHFGSVVATCSREPIGNQFCKSPPLKWLQRWRRDAFSRCNKAQWHRPHISWLLRT